MKKFRLKIGIDVDDILLSCNQYAIDMANLEHRYYPPLSIEELESWGVTGKRSDIVLSYFQREEFFVNQPLIPGAQEFIAEIAKKAEVFFITAIAPEFMGIRAARLIKEFPNIPKENIIMGYRKDMVKVDILLDDGAHNIIASNSAYPVLMRKPWNQHMTGCLSVNNFDEFVTLVDSVLESYSDVKLEEGNKVIALVGPSASGKTALAKAMADKGIARRGISYTTRAPRTEEVDGRDYHFVSKEEFLRLENEGHFFEKTRYAGELYGSSKDDVDDMLKESNVIMALDICGAIAVKRAFGKKALLVFINRPKADLVEAILERNCSNVEKTKRILSLSDEFKNEELCNATVYNHKTIEEAQAELEHIIATT